MSGAPSVYFDWNGTLLDDAEPALLAFNAVMRMFDVPEISMDRYQSLYEVPFIKLYIACGCDPHALVEREAELHAVFHGAYDEAVKTAPLREGGMEALHMLRAQGAPVIVLSNHIVSDIEAHAKRLNVRELIDDILANDRHGVAYKKSENGGKKRHLAKYAGDAGFRNGFIIGDTEEEIEIGHEFGLTSIAITGGMCSQERLAAKRPHHLIHSLRELPQVMRERRIA